MQTNPFRFFFAPARLRSLIDRLARAGDIPLVMQDEIHVRGEVFKVYGSPIGPAPASAPTQSGNVNAFNILAAAKAAAKAAASGAPEEDV